MVRITFLGTDAKTNKDNHFCLLIQHKRCKVLLDPSVSKIKNLDYDVVIISDIDRDHYFKINLVPKEIPIYSTSGIINYLKQLDEFKNRKLIEVERDTKLCERMKVEFFKTNKEVGHPSCGIKVEDIVIYPEIAPYIPQYNLKLLHKSHLIAGVGNYEKTDKKKISFLDFIKILKENKEGYKPGQLYITNLREDLKKYKNEVNKELENWHGKIIDSNIVLQYKQTEFWKRHKPKWRAFTIEDIFSLKEFIPNKDNKIVLDQKFDGKYVQVLRESKDKVILMVDPEELKAKENYIINERMQFQIKALKQSSINQFRCDAELVAFKKDTILHRTVANALANLKTKIDNKLASSYLRLYIYDITEYNNKDVRNLPLKERYELLRNVANNVNSIYVKFDIPITDLKKDNLSYIIKNKEDFKKIFYKIYNEEIKSLPKYINEGIVIKRLNGIYEYPQDSGLMKLKKWKEIDVRIINKTKVKGAEKTWNYDLGLDITKEYYEKLPNKNRIKLNDKYLMYYGRSDNTNINGNIGNILRVASEEVIRYENKDYPGFYYYKGYINRAMELVPEKNVTDSLETAYKLSLLEPQRIPIEEIQRWKVQVPEVIKVIQKDKDWGWVQFHIRGITKEEYEDKKKELWEKLVGHSLHADIRLDIKKAPKLMQFVLTESDWESYKRVFLGKRDPDTNNIQKGKIIIKPSAISKSLKSYSIEGAVLDKKAAKEIVKYDLKEHSFWIKPGEVGATPYTYSYMMTIWLGEVISGVQREDLHEFILKPYKGIPKLNQELINGRYIFRAFKTKPPTWWLFKAINSKELMDPKEHCDQQYYKLHKAEDIKLFGKEAYKKAGKC